MKVGIKVFFLKSWLQVSSATNYLAKFSDNSKSIFFIFPSSDNTQKQIMAGLNNFELDNVHFINDSLSSKFYYLFLAMFYRFLGADFYFGDARTTIYHLFYPLRNKTTVLDDGLATVLLYYKGLKGCKISLKVNSLLMNTLMKALGVNREFSIAEFKELITFYPGLVAGNTRRVERNFFSEDSDLFSIDKKTYFLGGKYVENNIVSNSDYLNIISHAKRVYGDLVYVRHRDESFIGSEVAMQYLDSIGVDIVEYQAPIETVVNENRKVPLRVCSIYSSALVHFLELTQVEIVSIIPSSSKSEELAESFDIVSSYFKSIGIKVVEI